MRKELPSSKCRVLREIKPPATKQSQCNNQGGNNGGILDLTSLHDDKHDAQHGRGMASTGTKGGNVHMRVMSLILIAGVCHRCEPAWPCSAQPDEMLALLAGKSTDLSCLEAAFTSLAQPLDSLLASHLQSSAIAAGNRIL